MSGFAKDKKEVMRTLDCPNLCRQYKKGLYGSEY